MKLEVEQFARLKSGYIVKILNIKDDLIETDTRFITRTFPQDFVKASFNIIDILEVGDYVNGYKIKYIDDCKGAMREFYYDCENPKEDVGHYEEEIKSVITHDQMEQMSYKVEE